MLFRNCVAEAGGVERFRVIINDVSQALSDEQVPVAVIRVSFMIRVPADNLLKTKSIRDGLSVTTINTHLSKNGLSPIYQLVGAAEAIGPGAPSLCTGGHYKSTFIPGSFRAPINTFDIRSALGEQVCAKCISPHSDALPASESAQDCKCNVGYTGPNGGPNTGGINCSACREGFYKQFQGDSECLPCGVNTYNSAQGGSTCALCTSFSSSPAASVSAQLCRCNSGYTVCY
jgi:hypothetical protein